MPCSGSWGIRRGILRGCGRRRWCDADRADRRDRPAATDFYYRRLIGAFAREKAALDLKIVHADTPTLLEHLASNDVAAQVAIHMRLTQRLVAAGAVCVAITSIAGHFCVDAFKDIMRWSRH